VSIDKRSAARLAIVQALYQMEVASKGVNEVFAEFESHWMGREIEGDQYKPAEPAFRWRLIDKSITLYPAAGRWRALKR
jgi:N utilization substance protein B